MKNLIEVDHCERDSSGNARTCMSSWAASEVCRSIAVVIYTEPPDSILEIRLKAFISVLCLALSSNTFAAAQIDTATRELSRDMFKQLIEINTTDSVGNVTTAAEAMAQRLRDAGFPDSDI